MSSTPLFFWPSDMGACRYYRSLLPGEAVHRFDGRDVIVASDERRGGRAAILLPRDVDDDPTRLVVLQRSHNPAAQRKLSSFLKRGRPFVYDMDDHLWAVEHDNPAARLFNTPGTQDTLTWMVRNASAVTVSTEPLADVVRARTDAPVHVFPNALALTDLDRWDAVDDVEDREPTIFWRGSATHDRDVEVMGYALRHVERDGYRIVLAGQDYRKPLRLKSAVMLDDLVLDDPEWKDRTRGRVNYVPVPGTNKRRRSVHLDTADYMEAVRTIVRPTVALCPLRSSTFNDCKSHIAALEGHAAGAFVIASRMPAYNWYLDGCPGGVTVKWNEHDWRNALRDALEMSSTERAAAVTAGRQRAAATSTDSLAARYAALYDTVQTGAPT